MSYENYTILTECPPKKGIFGLKSRPFPGKKTAKVFPFIATDEQVSIEVTITTKHKGTLKTIGYTSEYLDFEKLKINLLKRLLLLNKIFVKMYFTNCTRVCF